MKRFFTHVLLFALCFVRAVHAKPNLADVVTTTCKTYTKIDSNCSAAKLSELVAELTRLGLSEVPGDVADLTHVELKCTASTIQHKVGGHTFTAPGPVRETVSVSTLHGAKLEPQVISDDWSELRLFLYRSGQALKIAPDEAAMAYRILAPEADKSDSISEPRTITCLAWNDKVTVKCGAFELSGSVRHSDSGVLKVHSRRKLYYQLRYPRSLQWPEAATVYGCVALRAQDCHLAAGDQELRGEFASASPSPLVSLETVPGSATAPTQISIEEGVPWTHEWALVSGFSQTLKLTLRLDHEAVPEPAPTVPVEVPFWAALATTLPDKWQLILTQRPNAFGVLLISVLVVGSALIAWLKGRNWIALLRRVLGKPPAAAP